MENFKSDESLAFDGLFKHLAERLESLHTLPTLADPDAIENALKQLPKSLPEKGSGATQALQYVERIILPALAPGHSGPRYFGFVTGGSLPAAMYGDMLSTMYDQNVGVHLPRETISTVVEVRALEMLLDLLNLDREEFQLRTITTGATASNILGLACGRDFVVRNILNDPSYSVAEDGFRGITVKVLSDGPHASLVKAAAIVGIGRSNVIDIYDSTTKGINFQKLEEYLASSTPENKIGFIISPSFGEVNTGEFTSQMHEIRVLCNKYHAWIHVDGAFGAFVRVLPELAHLAEGLEFADSITGDGHKWLNVPYDAGFFCSRSTRLQMSIFGPSPRAPPPAYLTPVASAPLAADIADIPSPMNIGLENSRRFRGLPMFSALMSLGRDGYEKLVRRHIDFARKIGLWIMSADEGGGSTWYELLNATYDTQDDPKDEADHTESKNHSGKLVVPLNIVLFRAREGSKLYHPTGSSLLVKAINDTRQMYVSPGKDGAARLAVSNWMTGLRTDADGRSDYDIVVDTLRTVMQAQAAE